MSGFSLKRVALLFVFCIFVLFNSSTYAVSTGSEWEDPTIEVANNINTQDLKKCVDQRITVVEHNEGYGAGSHFEATGCVYQGKDYTAAVFSKDGFGQRYFAVKRGADPYIVVLGIGSFDAINVSHSSNRLVYFSSGSTNHILSSVENASNDLETVRTDMFDRPILLSFKHDKVKKWLPWFPEGNPIMHYRDIGSIEYSLNGRYALAWVKYEGHIKIDFQTNQIQIVTQLKGSRYLEVHNPTSGGITNDGRYAILGVNSEILDTLDCGYMLDSGESERFNAFNVQMKVCEESLHNVASLFGYAGRGLEYRWLTEGEVFSFLYSPYPHTTDQNKLPVLVTISKKSKSPSKLDYLALGDSYSSGEGDIGKMADGSSFYLPGTEDNKACHISARSYPFILATRVNIDPGRMKSVACSGARVTKDYYGASDTYYGQGSKLKGKTDSELLSIRNSALREFTPGILKQIDFVKENKPKTVTVTGGGNDIGFVDLMMSCIFAYGPGERAKTCDEAIPGTKKRAILGDAIQSQFNSTLKLVEALKQASDKTTVYIIGYPSFISDSPSTCINSMTLNSAERATINASVAYMNDVLAAAAKASGVKYISTKDSLNGGRICEGSEYVTGVLNALTEFEQKNNMFHPNADGHVKLADTLTEHGFLVKENDNPTAQESSAPAKPSTFGLGSHVPTLQEKLLTADALIEVGNTIGISSPAGTILSSGSKVSFTLYSNPVKLGTYPVSEDGSVAATVRIPKSVEPGLHMLVAEVTSGNTVVNRFYEYIEVGSGIVGDRDGDGIKDAKDSCLFITQWYDESTKIDICKTSTVVQQPGGGNNGGGQHNLPKPSPLPTWKLWKKIQLHHLIGFMICIGVFGYRFR